MGVSLSDFCPLVSVIIPVYNGAAYLRTTVQSVLAQTYAHLEIILVDDQSKDDSRDVEAQLARADDRVKLIQLPVNSGTLVARKQGMQSSRGDYVMLLDQDDELAPETLEHLVAFVQQCSADIYHFAVEVIPEGEAAVQAAAGMQRFLTPQPRTLHGEEILRTQFDREHGFDWHVHHKMYKGDFVRGAYAIAPDETLVQADDIYMCFLLCALAQTYVALPDSAWYRYYLGRGETLGAHATIDSVTKISQRNAKAFSLMKDFAGSDAAPERPDWDFCFREVRACLMDYPMNEWHDHLPWDLQPQTLQMILADWPAEYVCRELWRYTRDAAYALWDARGSEDEAQKQELTAKAQYWWDMALVTEYDGQVHSSDEQYVQMKSTALAHLRDTGLYEGTALNHTSLLQRAKSALKTLFFR